MPGSRCRSWQQPSQLLTRGRGGLAPMSLQTGPQGWDSFLQQWPEPSLGFSAAALVRTLWSLSTRREKDGGPVFIAREAR